MRVELLNFRGMGTGSSPGLLSEWRVGAIVQAVAVRDFASQQLWLDIAGQRHPTRIASGDSDGPSHGETLQLRVLRNSPVLALETLSSSATTAAGSGTMADALRKYVPRQESAALLLANLAWLAQGKNGAQTLPQDVVLAAARLWRALPQAAALGDGESLAGALARSGAFLEAHLAAGTGGPGSDIKALLLSLVRSLRTHGARASAAGIGTGSHSPVPTSSGHLTPLPAAPASFALLDAQAQQLNELARHAEGALARLTTTQIANCAMDAATHILLLELPVRHDDRASVLRLRIEQEDSRHATDDSSQAWNVEAAMDLGAAGGLHAKITLTGGRSGSGRVGVHLRAESPAMVEALCARSGELESALRAAGLDIDKIVCLHGLPAGDSGAHAVRLLDVKA